MLFRGVQQTYVQQVTDHNANSGGHQIPLRVYNPNLGQDRLPILLFIHGGGWVRCISVTSYCRSVCHAKHV